MRFRRTRRSRALRPHLTPSRPSRRSPSRRSRPSSRRQRHWPSTGMPVTPKKVAGLAVALVGVAAIVAGAAMEGLAKQASDSLTQANRNGQPIDKNKYSTGQSENAAGIALFAVGGAAAIVGVVVGVLGLREARARRVAVVPWLDGNSAGALVEVRP